MTTPACELSVVVACLQGGASLDRCLTALSRECREGWGEVLLVCPRGLRIATDLTARYPSVRLIRADDGSLVPQLWSTGLRVARGAVVAFTLEQCVVEPGWGRALLEALATDVVGAGGVLALDSRTTPVDWAVYLLRYSRFMPPAIPGRVDEIPGDNAAYRREALDRHAASFDGGFWEVDFHRRVHRDGGFLVTADGATATLMGGFSLMEMLRQRYLHGQHSGAMRTAHGGIPIWRSVLAAPLVPFVLTARIMNRVLHRRTYLLRAILSLPVIIALAGAWALGEATAAWRMRSITPNRPVHDHGS